MNILQRYERGAARRGMNFFPQVKAAIGYCTCREPVD